MFSLFCKHSCFSEFCWNHCILRLFLTGSSKMCNLFSFMWCLHLFLDFLLSFVSDRYSQKNSVVGNSVAYKRPSIRVSDMLYTTAYSVCSTRLYANRHILFFCIDTIFVKISCVRQQNSVVRTGSNFYAFGFDNQSKFCFTSRNAVSICHRFL